LYAVELRTIMPREVCIFLRHIGSYYVNKQHYTLMQPTFIWFSKRGRNIYSSEVFYSFALYQEINLLS